MEMKIVINGVELTDAQATTLRVAILGFDDRLRKPNALGPDRHGRRMTQLYSARLGERC